MELTSKEKEVLAVLCRHYPAEYKPELTSEGYYTYEASLLHKLFRLGLADYASALGESPSFRASLEGLRVHFGWFAMQVWDRDTEPYPMTTGFTAVIYYLLGWFWPLVMIVLTLIGLRFIFWLE